MRLASDQPAELGLYSCDWDFEGAKSADQAVFWAEPSKIRGGTITVNAPGSTWREDVWLRC
jgi:hypothetical protein